MTLYEFILLDEPEQAEAVWNGVHLAEHVQGHYGILLYQIDSFYVEVYYNRKHNRIDRLRPFASTEPLLSYLSNIDISALIPKPASVRMHPLAVEKHDGTFSNLLVVQPGSRKQNKVYLYLINHFHENA